ncbi:kinase-like domain-containing protein [Mycena sp. CBHHK59/15]|nr:kinase-like domain-containing protein [Mycena sp. CBHHK59/15]
MSPTANVYLVRHKRSGGLFSLKVAAKANQKGDIPQEQVIQKKITQLSDRSRFLLPLAASWHDSVNFYLLSILALECLHGLRAVHRDLQPASVLIDEAGNVLLSDFGSATHFPESAMYGAFFQPTVDAQCHTTARGGTPAFMSPAQHLGGAYSFEADVWGLGMLMARMPLPSEHAGRLPLGEDAQTAAELAYVYAHEPLVFREEDKLDEEVRDVLLWFLAKNAVDRTTLAEIKEHTFFSTIDWAALARGDVCMQWRPHAQYIPAHGRRDLISPGVQPVQAWFARVKESLKVTKNDSALVDVPCPTVPEKLDQDAEGRRDSAPVSSHLSLAKPDPAPTQPSPLQCFSRLVFLSVGAREVHVIYIGPGDPALRFQFGPDTDTISDADCVSVPAPTPTFSCPTRQREARRPAALRHRYPRRALIFSASSSSPKCTPLHRHAVYNFPTRAFAVPRSSRVASFSRAPTPAGRESRLDSSILSCFASRLPPPGTRPPRPPQKARILRRPSSMEHDHPGLKNGHEPHDHPERARTLRRPPPWNTATPVSLGMTAMTATTTQNGHDLYDNLLHGARPPRFENWVRTSRLPRKGTNFTTTPKGQELYDDVLRGARPHQPCWA